MEALDDASSSIRFLFLLTTRSSESVGGGDVVELVSSSDTSASSCPDFLQPRGLRKQQRPDPPAEAPPLEGEGVKQGTDDPTKEVS
jgi:hypothetical protein